MSIGTALLIIAIGYLGIKYHKNIPWKTLLKTLGGLVVVLVAFLAILIPVNKREGRKEAERLQLEQVQRVHQLAEALPLSGIRPILLSRTRPPAEQEIAPK